MIYFTTDEGIIHSINFLFDVIQYLSKEEWVDIESRKLKYDNPFELI